EVLAEAPVLCVELEQGLRVVHGSLELRTVPDHARVGHELVDVVHIEVGDLLRVGTGKGLADSLPLRVDYSPADPALEHRMCDRLEVTGEVARTRAFRRNVARHPRPQAYACSNIGANGRASKNASIDEILPSRTVYHS